MIFQTIHTCIHVCPTMIALTCFNHVLWTEAVHPHIRFATVNVLAGAVHRIWIVVQTVALITLATKLVLYKAAFAELVHVEQI